MELAIMTILTIIVLALIVYNIIISKKIKNFKDINQKVTSLNVLQDFMTTVGDTRVGRRKNCKNK